MDISQFSTLVFDCDGVVLDSNKVKTTAFYNAALPYGVTAAETLVEYHTKRGGISRYAKFEYFLEEIVGIKVEQKILNKLLNDFACEVKRGLLVCQISSGLKNLRQNTRSNWLLVSGGDQNELRDIFTQRNLIEDFNGGIFGSPDTKDTILAREIANGNIKLPALFIGDSKYDYRAATTANIDFVFVHDWTEVNNWREYCDENKLDFIDNISQLHNDATVVF
jgi:phosphoglycolate phosphatase-like HAD superfamily hydrolase